MSEEIHQPDPLNDPETPPIDRRRERRVEFAARCQLTVVSPAWAITTMPLDGMTQDITANGVRINFDRISRERIAGWREAVVAGEELRVTVKILAIQDFPELRGQIVWTFVEEGDGSRSEVPGAVGVMFSILANRVQQALLSLIESLPAS